MPDVPLDDVDRAILYELQLDARNNSNAEIAKSVGVSASTVGKRLARLEDEGIINGYQPQINYEQAGLPIHVLFICTASITEREPLIKKALKLDAVVNVREIMTGERNVHIQVVGRENDDITRMAYEIDEIGFTVNDEVLMRAEYHRPSVVFGEAENGPANRGH